MKYIIRTLRMKKGLSQGELAAIMGVTQGAVCQWENGSSHPKSKLLPRLAAALSCTVDELFGKEETS